MARKFDDEVGVQLHVPGEDGEHRVEHVEGRVVLLESRLQVSQYFQVGGVFLVADDFDICRAVFEGRVSQKEQKNRKNVPTSRVNQSMKKCSCDLANTNHFGFQVPDFLFGKRNDPSYVFGESFDV